MGFKELLQGGRRHAHSDPVNIHKNRYAPGMGNGVGRGYKSQRLRNNFLPLPDAG